MPRVYEIRLTYVVHVYPDEDGRYPEGEDLGAELSRGLGENMHNVGDTKYLDPDQYELIEEEAD